MRKRGFRRLLLAAAPAALTMAGPAFAGECHLGKLATIPVTMEGLRPYTTAKVNGTDARFILDSGAFFSTMSRAKATELALPLKAGPPWMRIGGIGGEQDIQQTTIKSFGFLGIDIKNVDFIVGGSDAGSGLIGANFLGLADTDYDLASGTIQLMKPDGCGGNVSLAYWTTNRQFQVTDLGRSDNPYIRHAFATVFVNGVRMKAMLDTGSPTSVLGRSAAERAGIDVNGPGSKPEGDTSGIGRRSFDSWVVPVTSFKIGDEEIQKTHLRVIGTNFGMDEGVDMLLGDDFFLSHHIYVARSQGKIYFTYNGSGNVFSIVMPGQRGAPVPAAASAATVPPAASADTPRTAEAFAARGNGRVARGDYGSGIADLGEALRLSPQNAEYLFARARAYLANGQTSEATSDLDRTIELQPGNAEAHLLRATVRRAGHDSAGALDDAEAAEKGFAPGAMNMLALAGLFEHLGKPAHAVQLYDGWIRLHPDDSELDEALNGRCWARSLANTEIAKALGDCNSAIRKGGPKSAYLDSRGMAKLRAGDFAGAVADYDAVLAKVPNMPWSLYGRGLARLRLGQTEAGHADLAAARQAYSAIDEEAAKYGFTAEP